MISMTAVWDRTTAFIGANIATLLPIAAVGILLPLVVQAIAAPFAADSSDAAVLVSLVALVMSVGALWGQITIIAFVLDPAAGFTAAVGHGRLRVGPAIGVYLVAAVGLLALLVPLVVLIAVAGVDLRSGSAAALASSPAAGGSIAVVALVTASALIWLSIRLILISPIIVMERRGLGSLARSFALTRGIAWKIAGVLILFGIVTLVVVLAVQLVSGSIFRLIFPDDAMVAASVATAIVSAVPSTILSVIAAVFTTKLYLAIRDAREAIVEAPR